VDDVDMFLIRDGERLPIASHGSHATCDGLKRPKCDGVLRIFRRDQIEQDDDPTQGQAHQQEREDGA
jgi:hypothetical protein